MAPRKFKIPRSADDDPLPLPQKKEDRKARPLGLTNAQWKTEVERRETVTIDRKGRDERKKAKDAAEAERAVTELVAVVAERAKAGFPAHVFSPHAGLYLPPDPWGSQASIVSPSSSPFSSSPSAFSLASPAMPHLRGSSEHGDGDPHSGFNPNAAFPHHPPPRGPSAFSTDTNRPYGGSSTCASSPA